MRPIILVACSKSKGDRPAPARDLYTSPLFRGSRRWAETHGDWFILSGRHHLLPPDRVIVPYNDPLREKSAQERSIWSATVAAQLAPFANRRIVVLAGKLYLGWLGSRFLHVEQPLKGLSIGQRLSWLKRENEPPRA